ncbi:nicotinamide-nucleotide adenylyltransferase [Patescibacteria group bacterium]|nr:nicotinamide-nucleotide adenylyltransferase [Patescibacteria group bacterium]
MKTGFYTGRFQPFHLGHLSAIKQALSVVDFLYIGIGSAQYSHEELHPFTADERIEMITQVLKENGIKKDTEIIPIPDIHDNTAWPGHVQNLVPPFDIVFVGDDGIVKELFEKHTDIPVKIVKKEVDICATDIRSMMIKGGDWKKYLPISVANYLERIDGIDRIS